MINNKTTKERNTTTPKTTLLSKEKCVAAQVGPEPTTLCSLDDRVLVYMYMYNTGIYNVHGCTHAR